MKEDGVCVLLPRRLGDGFHRGGFLGSLGIGVVFNLVCRHRSPSLPFSSWPPPLLFSLPPLAIILANGERKKEEGFWSWSPAFFVSNFGAAIGLEGLSWVGKEREWGPQTVSWAATLMSDLELARDKHSKQ